MQGKEKPKRRDYRDKHFPGTRYCFTHWNKHHRVDPKRDKSTWMQTLLDCPWHKHWPAWTRDYHIHCQDLLTGEVILSNLDVRDLAEIAITKFPQRTNAIRRLKRWNRPSTSSGNGHPTIRAEAGTSALTKAIPSGPETGTLAQSHRSGRFLQVTNLLTGEIIYCNFGLREHAYVATRKWPERDAALWAIRKHKKKGKKCDQQT